MLKQLCEPASLPADPLLEPMALPARASPTVRWLDQPLADQIGWPASGLGALFSGGWTDTQPVCSRYNGSTPQRSGSPAAAGGLHDGRVATVGWLEARWSSLQAEPVCVQIKGCGPTPLTEPGKDGWATVAECDEARAVSEALAARGIDTVRVLAVVEFEETVTRRRLEPVGKSVRAVRRTEQCAALVRVAPRAGLYRVGHFEYLFSTGRHERILLMVEQMLALIPSQPEGGCVGDPAHLPELPGSGLEPWPIRPVVLDSSELEESGPNGHGATAGAACRRLLQLSVRANAQLAAQWHAMGFVHGMLRTDNVSVLGFALDVGGSMLNPTHDPDANPHPREAMYSFGRQPEALLQCVGRLAVSLSAFVEVGALNNELSKFRPIYERALMALAGTSEGASLV